MLLSIQQQQQKLQLVTSTHQQHNKHSAADDCMIIPAYRTGLWSALRLGVVVEMALFLRLSLFSQSLMLVSVFHCPAVRHCVVDM